MNGDETISKGRQLYYSVLGWTMIVAVLGGGAWIAWGMYRYNPERRLAGVWRYDESSPWNAGHPGNGFRVEFVGRNIRVFDANGSNAFSYDWTNCKVSVNPDGQFPTSLYLMTTESELDGFVGVNLNDDETAMRFRADFDVPTRAGEFRRVR